MNNSENFKDILWGLVIGDALGTPLDGLGKGHLKAVFKRIDRYIDPLPALKGKADRWKKPGLYSSLSQLALLAVLAAGIRRKNLQDTISLYVTHAMEDNQGNYGIFRHTGFGEQHLLSILLQPGAGNDGSLRDHPCGRITLILLPILLTMDLPSEENFGTLLQLGSFFSHNPYNLTGSLLISSLLQERISVPSKKDLYFSEIIAHIEKLRLHSEKASHLIFQNRINPDDFLEALQRYADIFEAISSAQSMQQADEIIYTRANGLLKTPITRSTINHPLTLIPFSLFHVFQYAQNPQEALYHVALEGGTSAPLCALTASLLSSLAGRNFFESHFRDELVNKKRVNQYIDAIVEGKVNPQIIEEFLSSESDLTRKEAEELNSKLKHVRIKPKRTPSQKEKETTLAKHVVESWTKADKAKWKKERKRQHKDLD